jgi:hypothetical protein
VGERDRFLYSASADGVVRCTRLASGQSIVARHCCCTAMLACDLTDTTALEAMRVAKRQSLTPAAVAAANLGRLAAATGFDGSAPDGPDRRRMSLAETVKLAKAEQHAGFGRLVCADYRGHLYAYPVLGTETAVTALDIQRQQQQRLATTSGGPGVAAALA